MHDIIQLQGIIKNKKKKRRTYWLGLWLQNHLAIYIVNLFFLNSAKEKTRKPVFSEGVHVINFLGWWRG